MNIGLNVKSQRCEILIFIIISGVVYIKFAKTSEAARALEEMNGKHVEGGSRPIKVLIAHR